MINFFFPSDYSEMLFYTSTYHMQENLYKGSNNKELDLLPREIKGAIQEKVGILKKPAFQ